MATIVYVVLFVIVGVNAPIIGSSRWLGNALINAPWDVDTQF